MRGPRVLVLLLQVVSLQHLLVSMATRCHLAKHVMVDTYRHLRHLGEPFPLHCWPYNRNISFPDAVLPAAPANRSQCGQARWVVFESLREAELVFMDNELPGEVGGVTWDTNELDSFLNLQHRLVGEGQCLSSSNSSGDLSPYFRNVTSAIQQQDPCGWEVLRRDLIWVLKKSLQLHHHCFR